MVDAEVIRRKHDLLAAEMHHYFSDIRPELLARWKEAMLVARGERCKTTPAIRD
jgi:hypothetical protein